MKRERILNAYWVLREEIDVSDELDSGTKALINQLLQIVFGLLKDIYK